MPEMREIMIELIFLTYVKYLKEQFIEVCFKCICCLKIDMQQIVCDVHGKNDD